MIGRPRARFLVLADAVRVAPGMTECRHRDLARARAADVDHQETQRPADRRVRAIARAEDAEGAIETDARANGSVDDDEGRGEVGRGRDPVQIEGGIAGTL